MLKNFAALLFMSLITACFYPVLADDPVLPLAVVQRLPENPTTGQILSLNPSIPNFVELRGTGLPTQQTDVRLAYDDKNLYIAFRCREDRIDKLTANYTKRDDIIFRDDSVEMFVAANPNGDNYYHLVTNTIGAQYDERGKPNTPESWNGLWPVVVEKGERQWSAVITLPFESIGAAAPKPGDIWRGNFSRRNVPHIEQSCWSTIVGDMHSPERFGFLLFGGDKDITVSALSQIVRVPGRQVNRIHVSNPSGRPASLRAELLLDGKPLSTHRYTAPAGESEWKLEFDFPADGKHQFGTALYTNNTLAARTPSLPLDIPPYLSRLQRYKQILSSINTSSRDLQQARTELLKELEHLYQSALDSRGSEIAWQRLGQPVDEMERKVYLAKYAGMDRKQAGYSIGWETPLVKILRDKPFQGKFEGPARIEACRNEYEAVQIIPLAYGRELKNVSVSVSSLTGPNGAILPAGSVDIKLVEYVKTGKPPYPVEYIGWYPDPLMDLKPFDIPSGRFQPLWITVRPPQDVPAGVYRGQLNVKPANAPELSYPLEVRVRDFSLPKEMHLKTAFALSEPAIKAWYGMLTDEMLKGYYSFMLDRYISPTNIYNRVPQPAKENIPFCVERGMNAMNLGLVGNWGQDRRDEFVKTIKEYESFLKQNGWWDKAYIYGFDEIKTPRYHELKDMYGFIKEQFPDLPRMCTVAPNDELRGFVDIWVPLTSSYKVKDAKERVKAGDQVWWYVCCSPWRPYANWFIDYPAIDQRIIPWMNWKYEVPGLLYYAVAHWDSNRTTKGLSDSWVTHSDPEAAKAINEGKRWPEVPWNTFTYRNYNGDGHLIYPGPDGKPVTSIRFECLRDGIEDYEYFHILSDLVNNAGPATEPKLLEKAKRMLEVEEGVVKSLTEYTQDPEVLLKTRSEMADMIERLAGGRLGGS